tara:strand:- start:202 stop:495 length:294 start_codon:yes stop_codon:yes gene_type:complete
MSQRPNVRIVNPTESVKGICHKLKEEGIYSKFIEYMAEMDFEEEEEDNYQKVETFSLDKGDIEFFQWEEEVKYSWLRNLKTLNDFIENGGKIYIYVH